MINIEQAVCEKYPSVNQQPRLIRSHTFALLRKLSHEQQINQFLREHQGSEPIAFIDSVFDYFNFSYSVSSRGKSNIPAQGRVIIIANHPIGSLDGLALLRMVYEVRPDVKIMASDMLMQFEDLRPLFISADNFSGSGALKTFRDALAELKNEHAIIVFPAGEVSRVGPSGVKDTRWRPGFLKLARRSKAPVLPVHIKAKNSIWFYSLSMLYKPLGTALLAKEMFNKKSVTIECRVGELIPSQALSTDSLSDKVLLQRLKKYLYKIGKKNPGSSFVTEKTIAHPEDRRLLLLEINKMQLLGSTRDGKQILLANYADCPAMMREIGRLREKTFRMVGEGSGGKRDIDRFDRHYQHLVLWDAEALAVAGAYRLGDVGKILTERGEHALYTRSLFRFQPGFRQQLMHSVELGRSFVSPEYWGKNSLDYLWQGIGAYLQQRPDVRYLVGPVTISARFSRPLVEHLVFYYRSYYSCAQTWACSNNPFLIDSERRAELACQYQAMTRDEGFQHLQQVFQQEGEKVPVLLKQYGALFDVGGFQLLSFSLDPDFSDCLDGLFIADLTMMKTARRKRYLAGSEPVSTLKVI